MDRRTFALIAAASTCIVTTACAGAGHKTTVRPTVTYALPEIKKDCATCHLPTGTAKAGELKKKHSALCLDCHQDRKAPADHKVDFVPAREIKGLPLSGGMITCFTCHDPHQNQYGSLLRMKATDLCRFCHPV